MKAGQMFKITCENETNRREGGKEGEKGKRGWVRAENKYKIEIQATRSVI